MALKNERSWSILIKGMVGTIVIWTLSNFGVILMSLLLTGKVDYITWAFFWSGEYGCASTCAIYVIREKLGYMGAEELASVQSTREEIDKTVAASSKTTKASGEQKQYIKDLAEGKEPKEQATSTAPTTTITTSPTDQVKELLKQNEVQ